MNKKHKATCFNYGNPATCACNRPAPTEAHEYITVGIVLAIVLLVVGTVGFNAWNFITCFNVPLAQAPARCLILAGNIR